MKYYYGGEINGREFLYKNFIRRDNEPDDDLQADVFPPLCYYRENITRGEKGVRISESMETFPLFSFIQVSEKLLAVDNAQIARNSLISRPNEVSLFHSRDRRLNKERERKYCCTKDKIELYLKVTFFIS